MTTPPSRAPLVPIAALVLAVALVSVGCARSEDPKAAVTGQKNIGSASPATTAARSTPGSATGSSGSASGSASGSTGTTTSGTTKPNAVDINDYSFLPVELHVPVGTAVTWTNSESNPPVDHYVKSAPGQPGDIDSGNLPPGQSYNKTFATAGTFSYYCQIHNFMKATVVVQ